MPEPMEHTRDRNFIEDILRRVPGFRGYLEKEYRRASDDLQRDWLAERLQRAKRAMDAVSRPMADAGQIDALPQLDRMRGRLDKLIGRIRGGVQGYSGFFDLVRVDEPLLERVYEYDVALMEQVEDLARTIEQLPSDNRPIADRLPEILGMLDDTERRWDYREDLLQGSRRTESS